MVVSVNVPAIIRKEIRCCIAVKMLSIIFKENKMTIRAIYNLMNNYYHGTDNIRSHMEIMLKGDGAYKDMVMTSSIPTVNDTTSQNSTRVSLNKDRFVLETEYSIGSSISRDILELKNMKKNCGLVTGRMLHTSAMDSLKNMKKALAFLKLMPEVLAFTAAGCEYKSGISEDEVKLNLF